MMIVDSHGSEWVPNGDGTFRDLSSEIESMTPEEIESHFGPVHIHDETTHLTRAGMVVEDSCTNYG